MRHVGVWVVALGAALAMPSRAEAFCRTTTVQVPIDYDPVANGCWTMGTPLFWPMSRAPYGVTSIGSPLRNISGAEATRVADLAFSAWRSAACEGGFPTTEAFDDGPISDVPDASDCKNSNACDPAAHDVISFVDTDWPYDDTANTIALTTVNYGVDDGRIFEAFTQVNSANQPLTTAEPPPAGSDAYDLQAVLTHEAGHFFGLAHATETTSIMYAFYQAGAIHLTPDDVSGICAIYPPSSSSRGCSVAAPQGGSDSSGIAAALVALYAGCAVRRVRSRRASRSLRHAPMC